MLSVFLTDLIIGGGLKYLYEKQSSGLLYRSNNGLDSTTADILVFGSSRASHHYNPHIFEEKLKLTCYNCGRDAQGSIYSCAMISAIVVRYKPRCIIIDIRPNEFTTSDKGKIASLYPYIDNKIIRSYYNYEGPFEKIKFVSHIYPYNSLLTNLLVGVTDFNRRRSEDYKGYLPLKETKEKEFHEYNETDQIDTAKVRYFKELLINLDCLNIPTLVIISPIYGKVIDGVTVALSASICSSFKSIKFLNFTHSPNYETPKYFSDFYHLNELGANIFSNELISHISSIVK
jgi:hypothetical protein